MGCWLLDPDHPPGQFADAVHVFGLEVSFMLHKEIWQLQIPVTVLGNFNSAVSIENTSACCCHLSCFWVFKFLIRYLLCFPLLDWVGPFTFYCVLMY